MIRPTIFLFSLGLTACSLYESAGRKQLESNAYSLAGVHALADYEACGPTSAVSKDEILLKENDRALVLTEPDSPLHVRIITKTTDPLSCTFRYQSESARDQALTKAIEELSKVSHG